MKTVLTVIILLFALQNYAQENGSFEGSDEWNNFDTMADYLSAGSGKWTGVNPKHDPANERSPTAFGLWFERPMPSLMTIKIVAYMQDTIRLSSQGIFAWHPLKKQVIHTTSDFGNGYSEGISSFPSDTTFISTMMVYRRNGSSYDHKDENFIVSKDVHRNTSFGKDADGNWFQRGGWTWTRDPESK